MERIDGEDGWYWRLSTGRRLYVVAGVIGINLDDGSIHSGFDHRFHPDIGNEEGAADLTPWTREERAELADFMIAQWQTFKGTPVVIPESPTPWRVEFSELSHRKGTAACQDTCGKGATPIRVYQDESPGFDEHEMHVEKIASVEDIVDANGNHVVCFGHDYDDYGFVGLKDALAIVDAVNRQAGLLK